MAGIELGLAGAGEREKRVQVFKALRIRISNVYGTCEMHASTGFPRSLRYCCHDPSNAVLKTSENCMNVLYGNKQSLSPINRSN